MKVQAKAVSKMGGLGANLGSDDWEVARRKKEQAQKYAELIRNETKVNPLQWRKDEGPKKELSVREKALEFAKNVPKPKNKQVRELKDESDNLEKASDNQGGLMNEQQSLKESDANSKHLQELDERHDFYAD